MIWKKETRKRNIFLGLIALVCMLFIYLFLTLFEKESPQIKIKNLSKYISSSKKITLIASDRKSGLKEIEVVIEQGKKKKVVFKKEFPACGIFKRGTTHEFRREILIDPLKYRLSDGNAVISLFVRDYSKRNGFKGNQTILKKEIIIDTIPPNIVPLSRLNYFYVGGSGLIPYEVSKDTEKTGIYLNNIFFPAYKLKETDSGIYYVCYIGIPYNIKLPVDFYIWAEDRAGNKATARFYYRIKKRAFRSRKIVITDNFLKKVLPFFSYLSLPSNLSDIEKFLKINRELRKENNRLIKRLVSKSFKNRLWKGAWICLPNSKCTAKFGDRRSYFYKGKLIDHQVHLGLDLASISNSPIPASNSGRVIYTGRAGIYGFAVIIDHGQGVFSLYGHMSRIDVKEGQFVKKGDIIGLTGQTGLAGGDHLHFSIIVNGIFVNPEEWLDYHWLRDNIIRKLRIAGGRYG